MKLIFIEGSGGGIRWESKSSLHLISDHAPYLSPLIAVSPSNDGRTYEQKYFKAATGSGSVTYESGSGLGGPVYAFADFVKIVWSGPTEEVYTYEVLLGPGEAAPDLAEIELILDTLAPTIIRGIGLLDREANYGVNGESKHMYGGDYRDMAGWAVVGGSGWDGWNSSSTGNVLGLGFKNLDSEGRAIPDARRLLLSDPFTWDDFVDSISLIPSTAGGGIILPESYATPITVATGLNDTRAVKYKYNSFFGTWSVQSDWMSDPTNCTDVEPATYRTDWRVRAETECTVNVTMRCRSNQGVSPGKFAGGLVDPAGAILAEKIVTVECNILDGGDYVCAWQKQVGDHPKSTWFTEAIEVAE